MGQKWWGYKQAAPRGSPELRGKVKQRQKGWAICRSLASRLSWSQQRAGRNPSKSRNRPLSLELGRTIAHITSNFPVKNPTPAASTCLPLKPGGRGGGGLPSQQRRSLGLALTLHLSLPLFPGPSNPSTALPLQQTITGTSLTKKKRGGAGLEILPEAPLDDARTLGLCSVKGSEAWGLELNLLATVPQFPSLVSGLCPATSEARVPPSHRTATPSPFLTISCQNCSPRPCPSPLFDSTKDAALGRYAHHLPTVTQEEPDVPASPRDATASSPRALDPSIQLLSPQQREICLLYCSPLHCMNLSQLRSTLSPVPP